MTKPRSTAPAAADDVDADEVLKLDNQLCFPLYAASRLVVQAYRPFLDELGITYPQYLVLMVLWEQNGLTVKHIGERLYLDSGTLTPLLKRLEASGLIVRRRRSDDDRAVENHLTRAGRALKKRAAEVPPQLLCGVGISLDELATLRDTMTGLLDKLRAYHARADGSDI